MIALPPDCDGEGIAPGVAVQAVLPEGRSRPARLEASLELAFSSNYMHFTCIIEARLNSQAYLVVALSIACAQAGGIHRASAEDVPDIVWKTNAHGGNVLSLTFSEDGKLLATGAEDRTGKVWMLPQGALLTTVGTPDAWVDSIALYPPDNIMLTGGDDGGVRVWGLHSGSYLYGNSPDESTIVWSIAMGSNGSIAIGKSRPNIDLLTAMGDFTLEGHSADVYSVTFSRDASRMASASADGTARLWRVSDGAALQVLTAHSSISTNEDDTVINPVNDVDFSPDGSLLVTSGSDGTARLWRTSDGSQVRVLRTGSGDSAKFASDGKSLFTVAGGTINFWRVSDGSLLASYGAGAGPLAVTRDGKYFAYGRGDGVVVFAHVPLWVDSITQANGKAVLNWQGGSGLYQVQARREMDKRDWHNLGAPTRRTTFTHALSSQFFYRVISIPTN